MKRNALKFVFSLALVAGSLFAPNNSKADDLKKAILECLGDETACIRCGGSCLAGCCTEPGPVTTLTDGY